MRYRRALVLNADWQPITTVSWMRAVVLVLECQAEVLAESDTEAIHSKHLTMQLPLVLRLVDYREVPFRVRTPLTRRGVLARDQHRCCYCTRRKATTVDHVQPRSRGGLHRWENVVASCSTCNSAKDDRTPEEWGVEMRFQPRVPHGITALVLAVGRMDPAWEPYLSAA